MRFSRAIPVRHRAKLMPARYKKAVHLAGRPSLHPGWLMGMPPSRREQETNGSPDREVVLVMRLVLDRNARLRRGELLDADAQRQGRFASPDELGELLRSWLGREQRGSLG